MGSLRSQIHDVTRLDTPKESTDEGSSHDGGWIEVHTDLHQQLIQAQQNLKDSKAAWEQRRHDLRQEIVQKIEILNRGLQSSGRPEGIDLSFIITGIDLDEPYYVFSTQSHGNHGNAVAPAAGNAAAADITMADPDANNSSGSANLAPEGMGAHGTLTHGGQTYGAGASGYPVDPNAYYAPGQDHLGHRQATPRMPNAEMHPQTQPQMLQRPRGDSIPAPAPPGARRIEMPPPTQNSRFMQQMQHSQQWKGLVGQQNAPNQSGMNESRAAQQQLQQGQPSSLQQVSSNSLYQNLGQLGANQHMPPRPMAQGTNGNARATSFSGMAPHFGSATAQGFQPGYGGQYSQMRG